MKEKSSIPVLSVIIPTKDRSHILIKTLTALGEAIRDLPVEVIVVNDSSTGNIELPDFFKDGHIKILNNTGSGAASARNTGVRHATSDLLLFLDDDIIVTKKNLLRTLELHQEHKEKVCFTFMWVYPPDVMERLPRTLFGRYILQTSLFTSEYRLNHSITEKDTLIKEPGISSQYFSIRRSDFLSTGGYDESIPFAGVEDVLLAKKLRSNHVDIFLSVKDVVYQYEPDRLHLSSVMERYRKGAITCKKAYEFGHLDLEINFSKIKTVLYKALIPVKPFLLFIANRCPNSKVFDFLYLKLVNFLLGMSSYQGYRC